MPEIEDLNQPARDTEAPAAAPVFRFIARHVGWLLTPLFLLSFVGVIQVLNRYDLSGLPVLWGIRLLGAALLLGAVIGGPYLLWRREFHAAWDAEELRNQALHQVKEARRRLRRYGARLQQEPRAQIEAAIVRVESARDSGPALQRAVEQLYDLLKEHLHFGSKGPAREYAESIGLAVFVALFLRAFVVEAFTIPSGSMLPTLQIGDYVFVNKFVYGVRIPGTTIKLGQHLRPPDRGEVIVFISPREPDKDLIKRVVAVAGDTVDIRQGKLYVNGALRAIRPIAGPCTYDDRDEEGTRWHREECTAYNEQANGHSYTILHEPGSDYLTKGALQFPLTVPRDSVFVMGDNRDHSSDSRYWGFVPYNLIKGRAWRIFWSAGRGSTIRTERLLTPILP